MSKVFRYFRKDVFVDSKIVIPIIIGIIIVIVGILVITNQESDVAEVEDTLDKEIVPIDDEDPAIQEKYDEVEKIVNATEYKSLPREWQASGPFRIDRSEYAIGEKIFIVLEGLNQTEKGEIAVMRPLNATHYSVYLTIPFDGVSKSAFNNYIEPQISKTRGLCSVDDITGKWALVFRGTNYQNLNFEITERVVPGTNIEPVC